VKARAERLSDRIDELEVDLVLITDATNVRYLTGFTGSNGLALLGPLTRAFFTDFRYVEQAADEVHPSFERRRVRNGLLDGIAEAVPPGASRLGFERSHMSVREHERLLELLPGVELVGLDGLVEGMREIKEPEELESIRAAAVLADTAFERLLYDGLVGRTERELALALEYGMRERGADREAFPTIIAGGPHGARPHARPREVEIRRGDLVVIDWGAQLDGYCSDCTRTVAAGEVGEEARSVYELVLQAQLVALDAIRPGASGREVDGAARDLIDGGGYGDEFGHGLGHGVGLEVHEGPRLSRRSDDELEAGNVVTVEPGIYLPGRLGVRIEDLVAVTEDGREVLTSVSKRLIVTD
jgi:Xaa-Pro aminopeptidase